MKSDVSSVAQAVMATAQQALSESIAMAMVEINASGAGQPQPVIVLLVRMGCMRSSLVSDQNLSACVPRLWGPLPILLLGIPLLF